MMMNLPFSACGVLRNLVSACGLALLAGSITDAADPRPNTVFFLVDDMGWQDTSVEFHSARTPFNDFFRTPSMERLAKNGDRLTYDHFHGLLQGSRSYFPMNKNTQGFFDNGKATPDVGYTTDRIGDAACAFIDANKAKPFFLFVSFTAPHGPLEAKPEVLEALGKFPNESRRKYAGLVKSLDDNCGQILAKLGALGLSQQNTLVVFSNTNGGQTATGAINTPLRGHKGEVVEGGIRLPMAMRLPGRIQSGSTVDTPVITLDWLPTFTELADGKPDPSWKLDGQSLLPLVSPKPETFPCRSLHWRTHGKTGPIALRDGDWKLICRNKKGNGTPELYNLAQDIAESTNLAEAQPGKLKELRGKMDAWEATLKDPPMVRSFPL